MRSSMMRPRFVYLKKKKTARTSTATPAEPKADSTPIRIPRPVDPVSLILITIDVGAPLLFCDSGCCQLPAFGNVDVGIGEGCGAECIIEVVESGTGSTCSPRGVLIHIAWTVQGISGDFQSAQGEASRRAGGGGHAATAGSSSIKVELGSGYATTSGIMIECIAGWCPPRCIKKRMFRWMVAQRVDYATLEDEIASR